MIEPSRSQTSETMNLSSMIQTDEEFKLLLSSKIRSAMSQCQADYQSVSRAHGDIIAKLIQRAAMIAQGLGKSPNELSAFYDDKFWDREEGGYRKNREKLLLHCMQFMVGAPHSTSPAYNTASDYASAAQTLLNEGHLPHQLYEALRNRGGPYAGRRDRKAGEAAQEETDIERRDAEEDLPEVRQGDGSTASRLKMSRREDDHRSSTPMSAARATSKRLDDGPRQPRMFDPAKHIAVSGNEFHAQVLKMSVGDLTWVLIERVENEGKILRFDLIQMEDYGSKLH